MTPAQTTCTQCGYSLQPAVDTCPQCGTAVGEPQASASPRLNPFAFPSDTHFRFILLITAVLGTSLFIYGEFFHSIIRGGSTEFTAGTASHYFFWMVGGSLITLITAIVIYWWLPTWKIKRSKLRPLNDQAVAGITAYLTELCQIAGLPHPPQFFWNALDQTKEGYAFGRYNSAYVYLPRGVITSYKQNLPEFRAIVLHELAHIRNGDVHRIYFSFAIWWAFLATALPLFALSLIQSSPARMISMGGRVLFLYFLIRLIHSSVIRVREYYADLRSAIWSKDFSTLKLALESAIHSNSEAKTSQWRRMWLTHPALSDRRQILENPNPLLSMSFWTAFATGIAAMLPIANFFGVLYFGFASSTSSTFLKDLTLLIPFLIGAILIVLIVGMGTWRTTFSAILTKNKITGITKLGWGLALGIVIGQQFSFIGLPKILQNPIFLLLWLGFLTTGLIAFLKWLTLDAQAWVGVVSNRHLVNQFYRWGSLFAGVALAFFLTSFLRLMLTFEGGSNLAHFNIVFNPYFSFGLIALWLFPFSSWLMHKNLNQNQLTVSNYFFLDDSTSSTVLPKPMKLRLILASAIGLIFGLNGYLLLLDFRHSFGLDTVYAMVIASIIMQTIVVTIIIVCVKYLSSIHAIYAAFLAACSMSIISIVSPYVTVSYPGFFTTGVINSGGLFIIPTILILASIAARICSKSVL
jgi:Zn-dependent protease with chaperone function